LTIHEISARVREYLPLAQKIVESMNTELGKKIAKERFDVIVKICELLDKELENRR
jgi:hypothetical protein